jgi:hypothetical protein
MEERNALRLGVLMIALAAHGVGRRACGVGVDGRALNLILSFVQFLLELIASAFELAHALAQATGKGGYLFRAEEHKDQNGDDNKLWSSKWAKDG